MKTDCALRDRAALLAEYKSVRTGEQLAGSPEFRQFLAGARAGLEWTLGLRPVAPATGRREAVTLAAMEREEHFCDQAIYSTEPRPPLDPDYANGIEHALSWARGAEQEPPTPAFAAVPRAVCTCG
jgi:hypothetical protein